MAGEGVGEKARKEPRTEPRRSPLAMFAAFYWLGSLCVCRVTRDMITNHRQKSGIPGHSFICRIAVLR